MTSPPAKTCDEPAIRGALTGEEVKCVTRPADARCSAQRPGPTGELNTRSCRMRAGLRRRYGRIVAATAVLVTPALFGLTPTASAATPPAMVGLGDSYAAG